MPGSTEKINPSYKRQGYKRNDEWHDDEDNRPDTYSPERHAEVKEIIKKVQGQWWFVDTEDAPDWFLEFMNHWEKCECGKDRRSPEERAADKAYAEEVKDLPPSMVGDVVVEPRFMYGLYLQPQQRAKADWLKHVNVIYLRYSGHYRAGLERAMLSAHNQLADFQAAIGRADPVVATANSRVKFHEQPRLGFLKTIERLSQGEATIHFFILGLEGLLGRKGHYQLLYNQIRASSPPGMALAERSTITWSMQDIEARIYPNQAELQLISNGTVQRRCLTVTLLEMVSLNPVAKVRWLFAEFQKRVDGRLNIAGLTDPVAIAVARLEASLDVKRHKPYGNMRGNVAEDEEEEGDQD